MIVSGDLGRHGIAILSVREGLEFESPILSDTCHVWPAVEALLNAGIEIHCLRDLTRGGLATTLNEIASDRNICIKLEEALIPVERWCRAPARFSVSIRSTSRTKAASRCLSQRRKRKPHSKS